MELQTTATYLGPNIYSQRPVIRFGLEGLDSLPTRYFDRAFLDDLLGRLPGLRKHRGPCGAPDFFGSGEAKAELSVTHVFEHLCIELQNIGGAEVSCVRAEAHRIGPCEAVVPYEEANVCKAAAKLAIELIESLLPGELPSNSAAQPFDLERRLDEFGKYAERHMLPVQDRMLVRTARLHDVPATRLIGRLVQLGHGRFQQRLAASKTSHTNCVANDVAANKDYARRILGDLGLPVPRFDRVYRVTDAVAAAKQIGFPVVVKPNNGSMGTAVSVGMKNAREVRAAYKRARVKDRSVLVEEVVEGADYRMLVIDGKLVAASKRVPGHVVGDGKHTIGELLDAVNSDPRRGSGQKYSWSTIEFDEQAERLLKGLGYTRQSVPAKDEVVYLRRNANTSDGGTAVDVTDDVHPDNREIAVRAAKAIGLDISGVDFLTTDISTSMWENGGKICEINSKPGLRKHMWPAEGKPRDVTGPIIDMLFPAGSRARIPIVAVTGTGSTGTTARMLAHVLEANGHHVGLATGNRVYIGGRAMGAPRLTAPAATRMILLDPDVDVAVLEVTPDDVLRNGLGCDACDVTAIVNDKSNSEFSDEVIDAIRVVARTARKVVLLGDEDECSRALALDSGAADLCHVASKDAAEARGRTRAGGRRVALEGNTICIYDQQTLLAQIPMTQPPTVPELDPLQVLQSALFASASAYTLGQTPEDIHRSLGTFSSPVARKAKRKTKAQA